MKLTALLVLHWLAVSEAALRLRRSHRHLRARRWQSRRQQLGETMSQLYPFYHSTEGIRKELRRLAGSCPGMSLQSMAMEGGGPERAIDVVTLRKPGANATNKNFLLFGEHARELISPESGLHLVKSLCGETSLSQRAQGILEDSEFQIVVNGNPGSRREVESGNFCLRTNPNGVDLNRNWDEHWQADAVLDSVNTNPGSGPFSEFETRTFKALVEAYKPTTFLTIHSGTKGMYMPWAYDMEHLAQRNQPEMMQILKDLDQHHCQCPFGAAGREVGYSCPGTCLDWVYERMQTPFAFAFEIYVGHGQDADLRQRWAEKMSAMEGSFLQQHSHLAHQHFRDIFEAHPSSFVQVSADETESRSAFDSAQECFDIFNPGTAQDYQQVVDNWSGAYLDMAEMVVARLRLGGGHASAQAVRVRV